jgi:ABC-2 type transport system permease protein
MKWYYVFVKGIREQIRDFWILIMIVVMAPLFIAIYYLMVDPGSVEYDVVLVNCDDGYPDGNGRVNLGESLFLVLQKLAAEDDKFILNVTSGQDRNSGMEQLKNGRADVMVVIPANFSASLLGQVDFHNAPAQLEMTGDVTSMEYIVGAIWTGEAINSFALEVTGINLPVRWKETTLGYSGERSEFELYVPGLLILSIIMIIFSASAAIVREPETGTLERLKISRLRSVEFLGGISLVQIIIAMLSLVLALLTAIALGYSLVPGSLGFILLVSFLTALSMISFSLIVAAMCRSIKEVAIIGTFPLFLLMFFTGAAFPISGGKLFVIGGYQVMLNDILSPKWAVEALSKVLVRGLEVRETLPDMAAIVVLTILYFVVGTWAFRARHMRAG